MVKNLYETKRPLLPGTRDISATYLDSPAELDGALAVLASNRAALVGSSDAPPALVTISDLNKHPFRAFLYALFADLETAMAQFIEKRCDPEAWLSCLSEAHLVPILGFSEVTRRSGVDIGPLPGCTLTNLLAIVTSQVDLRMALGFENKTQAEKALNRLPKLRNKVMHPVRPLILGQDDVESIRRAAHSALDLRQRLQRVDG